jgi:hypothetical protein
MMRILMARQEEDEKGNSARPWFVPTIPYVIEKIPYRRRNHKKIAYTQF